MNRYAQVSILAALGLTALVLFSFALSITAKTLLLAFALSYLLRPLVLKMQRHKVSRLLSIAIIFAAFSAIVGGILVLLIPVLFAEGSKFIAELPNMAHTILIKLEDLGSRFGLHVRLDFENSSLAEQIKEHLQQNASSIFTGFQSAIKSTWSVLVWLLNLILLPIFAFYILLDYEPISRFLRDLIPPRHRPTLSDYRKKFNSVLSGYIRGQLLVAIGVGLIYSIGFQLIGLQFGLIIGIAAGVLSLIPYAGHSTAVIGSLGILVAYGADLGDWIKVGIILAVAQAIETYGLTPKLVGNRVNLSPLAVMLALIAGANVAGFIGALAAIPVAACLKIVLMDIIAAYKKSKLYT